MMADTKKTAKQEEPPVADVQVQTPEEPQPVVAFKPVADFVPIVSAPAQPKILLTRASHKNFKRVASLLRSMGKSRY